MGGRDEQDDGGEEGVEGQPDQAEPVYHHGGELPVGDDELVLVPLPQPLGEEPQLPQNHLDLLQPTLNAVVWTDLAHSCIVLMVDSWCAWIHNIKTKTCVLRVFSVHLLIDLPFL